MTRRKTGLDTRARDAKRKRVSRARGRETESCEDFAGDRDRRGEIFVKRVSEERKELSPSSGQMVEIFCR